MSMHVIRCGNEWHIRYPGLSQDEAQDIANSINSGALSVFREQKRLDSIPHMEAAAYHLERAAYYFTPPQVTDSATTEVTPQVTTQVTPAQSAKGAHMHAPATFPWHRADSTQVIAADGSHVTDCAHKADEGHDWKRAVANARLIAAAPDLLEALQVASVSCGFNKLNTAAQKLILSAIAKATT